MSNPNDKIGNVRSLQTQHLEGHREFTRGWASLPRHVLVLLASDSGQAWIVGGAVRDFLLRRPVHDIDFVTEHDAPTVIRGLESLPDDWHLSVNEQFRTVRIADGKSVCDIVTARRERYIHPAALPHVEPADLVADLYRRDFTVNALAVPVAHPDTVVAPKGSLRDLEAGVLRVFHEHSFVDDPTRLFRLARYQAELGFRPDDRTRALASEALPLLAALSPVRVQHELQRALTSPAAAAVMEATAESEVLQQFGVDIKCLRQALASRRTGPDQEMQGWLGLLRCGLAPAVAPARVVRLNARLARAGTGPQQLARASLDDLRTAAALHPDDSARAAAAYALERLSNPPILTGEAVQEITGIAPGPRLGQLLLGLREQVIRGALPTAESQKQWVREQVHFD